LIERRVVAIDGGDACAFRGDQARDRRADPAAPGADHDHPPIRERELRHAPDVNAAREPAEPCQLALRGPGTRTASGWCGRDADARRACQRRSAAGCAMRATAARQTGGRAMDPAKGLILQRIRSNAADRTDAWLDWLDRTW